MTDDELLRGYVRDHSETCFEELVRRHINLIYSAALRQVNQDSHLAEDIVQSVFTDLARKAGQLTSHPSLTAWLYTSTRFLAISARRAEQRRARREQAAQTMNDILHSRGPEPDWVRIRPLLDEAMHTLDPQDRQAVLMRHFENRSFAEIGASVGLSENAARMRVQRALEKLQGTLAKHGITSTAAALAGLLTAHAVAAAPAHLAGKVAGTAFTGAATAGGTVAWLSHVFSVSKTKLAFTGSVATLAAVLMILVATHHGRAGNSDQAAVTDTPTNSTAPAAAPNDPVALVTNLPVVAGVPAPENPPAGPELHLHIITADTGQPIPLVPIDYHARSGGKFNGKHLLSDRFGNCDVPYSDTTTELDLTTHKDDFADTHLLWQPANGDVIPTNYVLRIDRPAAIGGRVVDADGQPVAGAQVGWNHQDDPTAGTLPQNHEFGWVETITDQDGRWRINRIAEDMIRRIYGGASHSNYVDSGAIFVGRNKTAEQQLRDGTYVFKLGRAVTVGGLVTDAAGAPVAGAKILVGAYGMTGSRKARSQSDGTFTVPSCPPGRQSVTAEAPGFAATTEQFALTDKMEPVHLILKPGKTLRLRVVDKNGEPVPHAHVWYDNINQGPLDPFGHRPSILVQVDFSPTTDREGRVSLPNAPDAEMKFDVSAEGFQRKNGVIIRPDGAEHVIALSPALVVHGIVWDKETGIRIPKFRVVLGRPQVNPMDGTTNAVWSSISRFWLDFTGGTYNKSLEEALVGGTPNHGYILKFIADGYAPFISRVIGADEGDVEMNVTLQRAVTVNVAVNNPDGRPATDADIGLVFPGARLQLIQGGFSRANGQPAGSLLRTDAGGNFTLAPDDSVTRVIAASPEGYAEATPATLAANPVLQLQPWGNLQVTCGSAGLPADDHQYQLIFEGADQESIAFDPDLANLKADANRQISVSKLPPGKHVLMRIYPFDLANGRRGFWHGDQTPVEIRPGETTTLNLPASTYTVTASLQWPAGLERQSGWRIDGSLHTSQPLLPPDIATNAAARLAYFQSEAFKTARQNSHTYRAMVNADGTLSLDEVPPGDYELSAWVNVPSGGAAAPSSSVVGSGGGKLIAQGRILVTVPADPPSGSLDAGVVELENVPNTGEAAP